MATLGDTESFPETERRETAGVVITQELRMNRESGMRVLPQGATDIRPTIGGVVAARGILIIEDDFIIGSDLEYRLAEAGFSVVGVAASAREALALARQTSPRLAITDVRLAGECDGIETAVEMAESLGIRSIFATAHSDSQTRDRAARAKPLAWVQKPYSPEDIIDLVRTALSAV